MDEGQLTPDCSPAVTGRQAGESSETQIDFFFLPFFQASEEEDLKYPVTFRDGMCHEAEQRWSGMKRIQRQLIPPRRKENTPFPTLDSSKLRKNSILRNCLCVLARSWM